MATILDGKALANSILSALKERIGDIMDNGNVPPSLLVVQVGDDPASNVYIKNKERACNELGIRFTHYKLSKDITPDTFQQKLQKLRNLHHDGFMVQLPLPSQLDQQDIRKNIPSANDVDGLSIKNMGLFYGNCGNPLIPCTPKGILRLLKAYAIPLEGKNAVVVGRSSIVGKPIAHLLLNENCTVTVCHSRTVNLESFTRNADILVSAVGRPKIITADMIKPGAAVIDVGINRENGKLCGDVDFEMAKEVAGWITPVPGGIGPLTIAMLMENIVEVAEQRDWW